MAINNPIIDSGPTYRRRDAKQLYIKEVNMPPPQPYTMMRENGQPAIQEQPPERLGQMVHFRVFPSGGDVKTRAFVVVKVNGVLEWKPVVHEVTFIDPSTGLPWDPNVHLG